MSKTAMALAATGLVAVPAFLSATSAPRAEAPTAAPGLRGAQQKSSGTAAGAATGLALTVLGAAAAQRKTARKALRRELAVAYEDSGIDLLDNGKFAQGLVGSEGAWGRYEFDPLGFSKKTELVPYFREAELKHGRLAMLAWVGLVVPDFVRLPGEKFSFEAVPVSIDAHDAFLGATGVNAQVLFWVSILELCCAKKVFEWNSVEVAGDYGLTSLFPSDEEGQKKMRLAELKNGRLAMLAFAGVDITSAGYADLFIRTLHCAILLLVAAVVCAERVFSWREAVDLAEWLWCLPALACLVLCCVTPCILVALSRKAPEHGIFAVQVLGTMGLLVILVPAAYLNDFTDLSITQHRQGENTWSPSPAAALFFITFPVVISCISLALVWLGPTWMSSRLMHIETMCKCRKQSSLSVEDSDDDFDSDPDESS